MDDTLPRVPRERITAPVAASVRHAATDLLTFECARYGAMSGVVMVPQPEPSHLRTIARRGTPPGGTPHPDWLPLRVLSPVTDTAVDGRVRLVVPGRELWDEYGIRLPAGVAALTLPLVDGADLLGVVALTVPHPSGVVDRDGAAPVSARALLLAQQVADLERRLGGLRRTADAQAVVEQAKGMVAAYLQTAPRAALVHLRRDCVRTGDDLYDTALAVVNGELAVWQRLSSVRTRSAGPRSA